MTSRTCGCTRKLLTDTNCRGWHLERLRRVPFTLELVGLWLFWTAGGALQFVLLAALRNWLFRRSIREDAESST